MLQVKILKGLPASGKTSFALELVNSKNRNWVRVEKDCMRAMFHDSHWSKNNEKFVTKMRDMLIIQALHSGKHVVVSDTNLAPVHEERIRQIVREEFGNTVQVSVDSSFLDVSLEECIKRDLKRPTSVGEKVIKRMYNQFIRSAPKKASYDSNKEDVIICDVDGTLAEKGNRSPFDMTKVSEDTPRWAVIKTILKWQETHGIIIMSGRDDSCFTETLEWINKYGITPLALHMRKEGDVRKDTVIKEELYREHVEPFYNVLTIFDDRTSVVDMWRSIGLECFQVQPGDF